MILLSCVWDPVSALVRCLLKTFTVLYFGIVCLRYINPLHTMQKEISIGYIATNVHEDNILLSLLWWLDKLNWSTQIMFWKHNLSFVSYTIKYSLKSRMKSAQKSNIISANYLSTDIFFKANAIPLHGCTIS